MVNCGSAMSEVTLTYARYLTEEDLPALKGLIHVIVMNNSMLDDTGAELSVMVADGNTAQEAVEKLNTRLANSLLVSGLAHAHPPRVVKADDATYKAILTCTTGSCNNYTYDHGDLAHAYGRLDYMIN